MNNFLQIWLNISRIKVNQEKGKTKLQNRVWFFVAEKCHLSYNFDSVIQTMECAETSFFFTDLYMLLSESFGLI